MNSTVTSVTKRDVSLSVTRSSYRDNRDNTLWGVTLCHADPAMNWNASDLVPMPRFSFGGVTGRVTCAFALCQLLKSLNVKCRRIVEAKSQCIRGFTYACPQSETLFKSDRTGIYQLVAGRYFASLSQHSSTDCIESGSDLVTTCGAHEFVPNLKCVTCFNFLCVRYICGAETNNKKSFHHELLTFCGSFT